MHQKSPTLLVVTFELKISTICIYPAPGFTSEKYASGANYTEQWENCCSGCCGTKASNEFNVGNFHNNISTTQMSQISLLKVTMNALFCLWFSNSFHLLVVM